MKAEEEKQNILQRDTHTHTHTHTRAIISQNYPRIQRMQDTALDYSFSQIAHLSALKALQHPQMN